MPRYLFKCGCCDEKVEIHYDKTGLEINGVNGSIQNWREILLPLLGLQKEETKRSRTSPAHAADAPSHAGTQ